MGREKVSLQELGLTVSELRTEYENESLFKMFFSLETITQWLVDWITDIRFVGTFMTLSIFDHPWPPLAGTWENVREVDLIGLDPDAAVEGVLTGGAADFQVEQHRVEGGAVEAVPGAEQDKDN